MKVSKGTKILSGTSWKYGETIGTVIKETRDGYVVVIWENVNGEWHYTPEQFERFERLTTSSKRECQAPADLDEKALSENQPD